MATEQSASVCENIEIARAAARYRRFLIVSEIRFATFWAVLVTSGIAIGIISFRAELNGFAFAGFVGALAAATMVWMAIVQILDVRSRSDRRILFLGPPKESAATASDQASTQAPPAA